jgi:protein-S-isoprenylcysteine O-methyltransferase Ste14
MRGDFGARGGWWVVAQVPIMFAAVLVPLQSGSPTLDAGGFLGSIGIVLAVIGLALTAAGLASLGRALTPFPRPLDGARLRQSGIDGWMRHPVYGGLIVASLGWALAWHSVPGLLVAGAVAVFFDRKSDFEERMLREQFPEYEGYAQRVRKFIPGVY